MIRATNKDEVSYISRLMGYSPTNDCKGVVYSEHGVPDAAALYDHWTPNSVNVHIWANSPKPLFNPHFQRAIFSYPFFQCQKNLLIAITPADNAPSLKFSESLGFRETYRIRDGWKIGVDLVIKELTRDEWVAKRAA